MVSSTSSATAKVSAARNLPGEQLAPAAGAGQDRLPGAEVVLGGEDVPGHHGGAAPDSSHWRAEPEHDHRDREAGAVHPLAERGVPGRGALHVQHGDGEERAETASTAIARTRIWRLILTSSSRQTTQCAGAPRALAAGPA